MTGDQVTGNRAARPAGPLPSGLRVTGAWCAALLLVAFAVYVTARALTQVWLVAVAVVAALLLAALFHPVHELLRRARLPEALAALVTVLLFLGVLAFSVAVIWGRAASQLDSLRSNVAAGLDAIRDWLVDGPLSMRPRQVDQLVSELTGIVWSGGPSGAGNLVGGARMAVEVLSGVVLALFLLFFLLKDGRRIWGWFLGLFPPGRRRTVDGAGRRAWESLSGYVRGTTAVALVDAVLVAVALLVIRVPLVLPLALLTFFGAYVPLVGATVAGAAAVLVALVTGGPVPALLVLGAVLLVQQVEGNILQPWIMRRAVNLHPVPLVLAVTVGSLIAGVAGAVIAVPLLAVGYHVGVYLLGDHDDDRDDDRDPPGPDDPEHHRSPNDPGEREPVLAGRLATGRDPESEQVPEGGRRAVRRME